jgi:hypothetical protein
VSDIVVNMYSTVLRYIPDGMAIIILLLGKLYIFGFFFSAQTDFIVQAFRVNHYLTDTSENPPSGTMVLTGNG